MADPRYQKPKQHSTSRLSNTSCRKSSFYRDNDEEIEQPQDKYDCELDEDDEDQDQDQEDDRYSYRRRNAQPHQQQQQQQQQQETDDDDDDEELNRQPKKRKLKSLMNYELAPRSNSQPGGSNVRNSSTSEWSERETFALLEAWGNRYLELGRKSLRSEDWVEVAENVSEVSKTERLDTQCRNRLDTLKKNYKKEKAKMNETGGGGSRWVYFKKMDMLMAVSPKQECMLACGVDSGEYVFMNPKVYLNCANGFDEMRDSPGNSEGDDENDDDGGDDEERSSSVRMLTESIQKFSTIYEKIENSKRQQMMELEKMRLDFHNELELENKQLLKRVQTEIEKIHEDDNDGHNDDHDDDNGSGGNDDIDDDNDDTDDASAENNLSV